MKKITLALSLVLVLAMVFCLGACGPKAPVVSTGKYYAPVHGAGYVGEATVTVTDGKVTSATLDEACFPTYVQAPATVTGDDVVETKVTSHGSEVDVRYYKTVKFGSTTAIFDVTDKTYKVNGVAWLTWLQTEANAQSYFEAVVANNVAVVVNGAEDRSVMTAKALLKSKNGYGGTSFNWAKNVKATIDYIVSYGFDKASTLQKNDETKLWVDANGIETGATWNDMNKNGENYFGYIKLLTKAYEKIAK